MSESNPPPPPDPSPFDPPPPATQPAESPPRADPLEAGSFDTAPSPPPGGEVTAPPPVDANTYDTAPAGAAPPPPDAAAYAPRPLIPPEPLPYGGAMGYPGPYIGPPPDKDATTMGMLAHLLGILLGFLGPLIIWLIKKDTSPFVNDQGKESLNFQLTLLIGYLIAVVTSCILIGMFIAPIVWIVGLVFAIMGTIKANNGEAYRYPFNIRFIK